MFSCEFYEISKNTLFYRTSPDDCFWTCFLMWMFWKIPKQFLEVFCQKGIIKNFAKFTSNSPFNDVGLSHPTLLEKRPLHRCFPIKFAKFSWTPFLIEHLRWLLLKIVKRSWLHGISDAQKYVLWLCSTLDFTVKEWFCYVTSFTKVFLCYCFFLLNIILSFYNTHQVRFYHLHRGDYCRKCEYDTDVKIEYNISFTMMENNYVFIKKYISKHRAKRRMFL